MFALWNYSLSAFSIMGNIWGRAVSTGGIYLCIQRRLILVKYWNAFGGALIVADTEIGPLGLYVTSCQSRTRFHNLSPFKVWQLAEILRHMRLWLFPDIKNQPSDHCSLILALSAACLFRTAVAHGRPLAPRRPPGCAHGVGRHRVGCSLPLLWGG